MKKKERRSLHHASVGGRSSSLFGQLSFIHHYKKEDRILKLIGATDVACITLVSRRTAGILLFLDQSLHIHILDT